jgi:hypothetical protein
LLLFASAYAVLSTISVRNFGQPLTHTDALYFTVTVFSTVGFGDITAKTDAARLVVTSQMIADLLIIGLVIRVFLGAVTLRRQRQPEDGRPRLRPWRMWWRPARSSGMLGPVTQGIGSRSARARRTHDRIMTDT